MPKHSELQDLKRLWIIVLLEKEAQAKEITLIHKGRYSVTANSIVYVRGSGKRWLTQTHYDTRSDLTLAM